MKVTDEEYKVISRKKALYFCILVFGAIYLVFFTASHFASEYSVFWTYAYILLWFLKVLLGVYGLKYGSQSIASLQYPPPDTWVIQNWQVMKGRKAYWYGQGIRLGSLVIICMAIYMIYLILNKF